MAKPSVLDIANSTPGEVKGASLLDIANSTPVVKKKRNLPPSPDRQPKNAILPYVPDVSSLAVQGPPVISGDIGSGKAIPTGADQGKSGRNPLTPAQVAQMQRAQQMAAGAMTGNPAAIMKSMAPPVKPKPKALPPAPDRQPAMQPTPGDEFARRAAESQREVQAYANNQRGIERPKPELDRIRNEGKLTFIRQYGFDPDLYPARAAQIQSQEFQKLVGDYVRPGMTMISNLVSPFPGLNKSAADLGTMLGSGIISAPVDMGFDAGVLAAPNSSLLDRVGAGVNIGINAGAINPAAPVGAAIKGVKALKTVSKTGGVAADLVGDALKGAGGAGIPKRATVDTPEFKFETTDAKPTFRPKEGIEPYIQKNWKQRTEGLINALSREIESAGSSQKQRVKKAEYRSLRAKLRTSLESGEVHPSIRAELTDKWNSQSKRSVSPGPKKPVEPVAEQPKLNVPVKLPPVKATPAPTVEVQAKPAPPIAVAKRQSKSEVEPFSPKHESTEILRRQFGLPERTKTGKTWDEAAATADKKGYINSAETLAKDVIKNPRALSDAETIGLGIKGQRLASQVRSTEEELAKLIDSGADGATTESLGKKLRLMQDDLYNVVEAIDIGGTETGRGLNARRILLQGQYDDLGLRRRALSSKRSKLSESEITKVNEQAKKISDLEKRLSAIEGGSQGPKMPRERRLVSQERFEEARKQMLGSLNTGLTAEQAKAFKDVALYHIESGIIKVEEIAKKIREALPSDKQSQFSDHDIAKAIRAAQGEYGRQTNTGRAWGEDIQIKGSAGIQSPEIEDLRYQLDLEKTRADGLIDALRPRTAVEKGAEVLNTVRSVMTSLDISAPGRQGLILGLSNPGKVPKAFGAQLKAFASEKAAYTSAREIAERPNAKLYKRSGLYLSPIDTLTKLSAREENFMSNLAGRVPGVKASERAYSTYLNRLRSDVFDTLAHSLAKDGKLDDESAKAIANYVNIASGRGDLGKAGQAAEQLNTIFFAPRYVASRFQYLAGQPLAKGNAATRKLIAKEYAKTLIGFGVVVGAGKLAGAKVEHDPRSTDFGKLRFGDTRVDFGAGLGQTATFLSKMISGQQKDTETGTISKSSRENTAKRFIRSKVAPVPGAIWTAAHGKDYIGKEATLASIAFNLLPMSPKELYNALQEEGLQAKDAAVLLNFLGVPVSDYTKEATKD